MIDLRIRCCACLAALLALTACESSEETAPQAQGTAPKSAQSAPEATDAAAGTEALDAESDQAIAAIDRFIAEQSIDTSGSSWKTRVPRPPAVEFHSARNYFWILETSEGPIKVQLRPGWGPYHVASTIYLTRLGFYDGLGFHRVIPGFMAQGGCPLGNGTGNPGYGYAGEFDNAEPHNRGGMLSMANAGPNTDGSQFFLTFAATPHLNGRHTTFGEVVDGESTMKAMERLGSAPQGRTSKPITIERATITVE